MLGLLLTLQILVSVGLAIVVLLQRSEGGALGMGGGGSNFMTARGAGDLLTRTTWILCTAFFVLVLALTVVTGRQKASSSVVDRVKVEGLSPEALKAQRVPATPAPSQAPASAPAPFEAPRPTVDPFGVTPAQPASPPPVAPN
jgi:preprotein translocase subunit SecG